MPWTITLNCGRKKSPRFRRRTIRRVRWEFKRYQPFMNLQEIDEADSGNEHSWLRKDFREYKWCNFRTRVPIGVGRIGWRTDKPTTIFGHKGIAKLTPHRPISKVPIWRRWNRRKRLVMYNNHLTRLGARGGKLALRKRYHAEYIRKLSRDVHEEVDGNGETALIHGDFNTRREPKIHPRQRVLMHRGLDWIIVVEPEKPRKGKPKVHVDVKQKRVVPMNIDGHDVLAVKFGMKLHKV